MGYHEIISKYEVLSKEETNRLVRLAQNGDDKAFNKLIKHNLRLVVKIANQYKFDFVDLDDLIQEGNIALMKAVKKYNPDMGVWFVTYASMWIRAKILRFINTKAQTISIGEANTLKLLKIRKLEMEHSRAGREISINELAKKMKSSVDEVLSIMKLPTTTTLDVYVSEHSLLSDRLAGKDYQEDEEDIYLIYLDALISDLPVFEEVFVRLYYGLEGNGSKSVQYLADIMGFTPSELVSIKQRALATLSQRVKTVHYV